MEDPLEEGMATHSSILAWRIAMDRGAWQAMVHGVAKSRTQLKQQPSTEHIPLCAAAAAAAESLQSCPTLCDPRDGSPAGSPIPGILQARVAISFSVEAKKSGSAPMLQLAVSSLDKCQLQT